MKFQFNEQYILEDELVQLRPIRMNDLDHLLSYSLIEPETWQFNQGGAEGKDRLKSYIQKALTAKALANQYPFIIYHKPSGRYIGSSRFYAISAENNNLEIGYTWYGKAFRGTGVNKHCKFLLLQFAFEKMQVDRVGFKVNQRNERSVRALLSIGCKPEGILRNASKDAAGHLIDEIIMSILKSEWEDSVKIKLSLDLMDPAIY